MRLPSCGHSCRCCPLLRGSFCGCQNWHGSGHENWRGNPYQFGNTWLALEVALWIWYYGYYIKLNAKVDELSMRTARGAGGTQNADAADTVGPAGRRGKRLPVTLTAAEVDALRAACTRSATGLRNRAMIEAMLGAGLRVSEVVALMPRDIDWQAGTVCVSGGKSDRVVPVSDDTLAHLQVWQARRAELKLSGQQPFFGGIRTGGRRMSVQNVQAALKKLAARAGIQQRVSPHVLRHTYATRALDSGLTIREVQSLLGHSDVSTTMIYAHVNPEALRCKIQGDERADRIAELQAQLAQLQAQLTQLST